ncbi:hypothetical protein VTO42DRAFT_8885 [Malbranchea cinnamomea]
MTEPQPSRRDPLPMSNPRQAAGSPNGSGLAAAPASFSQSFQRGSFSASQQSVASTPNASSPPPPRASQMSNISSMSFGSNLMSYGSSLRGYPEGGYGSMPHREPPQIYTAVYSNVSVYEMEVNGVAVMRRRSDSWLNATQILKVAGVVKARRTKTLEKEIAQGEHEKVQGGYGKYQGTWVSYQRGVELCRQYGVEDLLRPLLEYDMGQDGSNPGQGAIDTPTKEQAMAAQRKRMYHGLDGHGSSPAPQGTFFQNISRTAVTAVNAISKARFDSPVGRGSYQSVPRKSSQMSSQESHMPVGSQQSLGADSGFGSNIQSQRSLADNADELAEPPRKRMRSSSAHMNSFHANPNSSFVTEPTPTEPNDSFYQPAEQQMHGIPDDPTRGLPPLPSATTPEREQKMKLIMTLFLDKRAKDFSNHPAFLTLSGEDLEIPLDEYCNNALHWAAMLARLPLVHALVAKGVSIYRLNAAGETALQKAVGTRNNYDYRSFSKLLQVLAPTIEIIDGHGRTVLHHIAMMAATGGGGHLAAKHYLEALLEFIVRHGGPSSSQKSGSGSQEREIIGLGRFMSEMVNVRDDQGDTALNLAGRARTVLVPQLLEVGANPHIPNHTGLRPADYGVGVDMVNGGGVDQNTEGGESFLSQLNKTKKEILESTVAQINSVVQQSLEAIDKELSAGLAKKQDELDQWHAKIRDSAKARQIEQNRLDDIKRKARERVELDRRIRNLEQSSKDLAEKLKELSVDEDLSVSVKLGDADKMDDFDIDQFRALFDESFDPSKGFSEEQRAFLLSSLPSLNTLKTRIKCYEDHNARINAEIDDLKSKNVVLGENYRRMVMACTGWSAEKVDEAAEGLTECIKDLNENPLPEDVAIEILMKDRGQDW